MTGPELCLAIAAVLFVVSFMLYKKMHETAGDRMLFAAYSMLAYAWVVPNVDLL